MAQHSLHKSQYYLRLLGSKNKRVRGGEDSYALSNYVLPGYNYYANTYEKHLPLNNYTGPGSWIQKRWVERKLHGTNPVDEAARHHDIQYNNLGLLKAKGKITQQQLENGIVNSDKRLMRVAQNNLYGTNPLAVTTAHAVSLGIQAKRGLQDMNILNKAAFTSAKPDSQFIDEDQPGYLPDLSPDYLQGGKKKKDRLTKLRKSFKKLKT